MILNFLLCLGVSDASVDYVGVCTSAHCCICAYVYGSQGWILDVFSWSRPTIYILFYFCVEMFCLHVGLYTTLCVSYLGGLLGALDSLALGLQMLVSQQAGAGNGIPDSGRTVSAHNGWTILAPLLTLVCEVRSLYWTGNLSFRLRYVAREL